MTKLWLVSILNTLDCGLMPKLMSEVDTKYGRIKKQGEAPITADRRRYDASTVLILRKSEN